MRFVWDKESTGHRRPARYVLVGGFNAVVGLGVFAILDLAIARYVGHYVVLTLATIIVVATAHTTQRRMVWSSDTPYFRELVRFSSVYAVSYVINLALLYIAHAGFGAPVIPAQLVIAGLLTIGTYVVHRVWTFATPGS